MEYLQEKQSILRCARLLWEQGMAAAHDGNLSLRLPGGDVLITASGKSKGALTEADILLCNSSGQLLAAAEGRVPSMETAMHLAVLAARADAVAVVHAHPPYATACTLAGCDLAAAPLAELELSVGRIAQVGTFPPGSPELAAAVGEAARDAEAVLLQGHGAITVGKTPEEALFRMEALEHGAKIWSIAQMLQTR